LAEPFVTSTVMANDYFNVYIATKMIELAERDLVLDKLAEKFPLPQKSSKSLRVVQVQRLALPNAPAVEGVTPPSSAMTLINVDVTVQQWIIVVTLTDVVDLVTTHPMVAIATERVALAMKEVKEREAANALMAAPNVTYAKAATSRGGLAATDIFDTALAITCAAKLKMRGAPKYSPDGTYFGVMQPPHTAAILGSDQTFQTASSFSQINNLRYGYLGPWMNIDWAEGNFLPVYVGVAAPDTAATTATKAQYTVGTAGTLASANYQLKVVGREISTNYERRLSVQTGNIAVTTPGSIAVKTPNSTNYVYDIYMTQAGGTTSYLMASQVAAATTVVITTAPIGTEPVSPVSPSLGINVYPGFVLGKSAFGCCELNGMSLQTFVTPKGPSDSDPAAQRRKIAAKYMDIYFILEGNFIERFETSSALQAAIPA